MAKVRWAEVTLESQSEAFRFECLSQILSEAGVENEFKALTADEGNFASVLAEAQKEFTQIRISGDLGNLVPALHHEIPSMMLTLKTADALVLEQGHWWPRNFLYEGMQQVLAQDLKNLDLNGGALVFDGKAESRAVVAALVKAGFNRINIADNDDHVGRSLVEEFRRSYFNVQFQYTHRSRVTQLPGVHAIAVNTRPVQDPGVFEEISYFNFLRPGGVWMDVPLLPIDSPLVQEAAAVGAVLEPGLNVATQTDSAWARTCFKVRIDLEKYRQNLRAKAASSV